MSKLKAWLILGAVAAVGGLLLWFGLAIVVRCELVEDRRVNVTVERRFLGLLTLARETVPDVINADVSAVRGRSSRGSTGALLLTLRDGAVVRRTQFGPSFGSPPAAMAVEIRQFIAAPSPSAFTTWWMPWLVNLAALPFVLIFFATAGEVILRGLRVMAPEPGGTSPS
jgi:hypothetical protein